MKNSLIRTINSEMNSYLNNYQLEKIGRASCRERV